VILDTLLFIFIILRSVDISLTLAGLELGLVEMNPLFRNRFMLIVGSIAIGLFGIYTCVQVERSSYGAAVALAAIACGWALIIDIRNFDLIRRVK
jgi:hypothetical protein